MRGLTAAEPDANIAAPVCRIAVSFAAACVSVNKAVVKEGFASPLS